MILTLKQTKALDYLEDTKTTELLYGGAAGGGKSLLGCYWQIKRRLKYPGTRGLIGRSKLKTLKDTTLKTFFEVCNMQGLKNREHFKYNPITSTITFFNKSEIILKDLFLYPSDPDFDELGSLELTDAFIDEANQVTEKARNIVKSRIRFKLSQFNLHPKFLMSCNPAKNWTYNDFYKPSLDGTIREDRKFIQALLTDNPHLPESYRQSLYDLDEVSKQRLLYGNWDYSDEPTEMIAHDKVTAMYSDKIVTTKILYITVDVARFGKDASVIMVWDGLHIIKIIKIAKNTIPELVDIVAGVAKEYKVGLQHIVADEGGLGAGFIDMYGCKGFLGGSKAKNRENYLNLRSQSFYKLADIMNKGKIKCINTIYKDEINQELSMVRTHKMDSDGKKQVLPKDKIKQLIGHSPDFSDNFSMRMYWEIGSAGKYARPNSTNRNRINKLDNIKAW